MDSASSELVKYSANAMLAVKISFMNELSSLAASLGADIDRVREGIGTDSRIGPMYLYPGPGYGGACLPKDTSALSHMADVAGQQLRIVNAAREVNTERRHLLGQMVLKHFGSLRGRKICIWGTAFKAETDDIRESPAISVIEDLLEAGASVTVHDPHAANNAVEYFDGQISSCADMYDAVEDADALILCTEWRQYRSPDVKELYRMSSKLVAFDGRNIWDKSEFDLHGVKLFNIVRGSNPSAKPLSPSFQTSEDNLQPVGVLNTSDSMIPPRRPLSLQDHAVDVSRTSVRALSK
jgi:UDPglucose 6-dehydrogenase